MSLKHHVDANRGTAILRSQGDGMIDVFNESNRSISGCSGANDRGGGDEVTDVAKGWPAL